MVTPMGKFVDVPYSNGGTRAYMPLDLANILQHIILHVDNNQLTKQTDRQYIDKTTKYLFRIVGIDLDHTIIKPHGRAIFSKNVNDWELKSEYVITNIKALINAGYIPIIFTNQKGINTGKSLYSRDEFENIKCLDILRLLGREISDIMYIYVSYEDDTYRKPHPDMFIYAINEIIKTVDEFCKSIQHGNSDNNIEQIQWACDIEHSLYIGDMAGRIGDAGSTDYLFAHNMSVNFIDDSILNSGDNTTKICELSKSLNQKTMAQYIKDMNKMQDTNYGVLDDYFDGAEFAHLHFNNNKTYNMSQLNILSQCIQQSSQASQQLTTQQLTTQQLSILNIMSSDVNNIKTCNKIWLMILMGSPGSGKTTCAYKIISPLLKQSGCAHEYEQHVLSRDNFTTDVKFYKHASQLLNSGKSIILDKTYGTIKQRSAIFGPDKSLLSMLTQTTLDNLGICVVHISVDKKLAIHTNEMRRLVYKLTNELLISTNDDNDSNYSNNNISIPHAAKPNAIPIVGIHKYYKTFEPFNDSEIIIQQPHISTINICNITLLFDGTLFNSKLESECFMRAF